MLNPSVRYENLINVDDPLDPKKTHKNRFSFVDRPPRREYFRHYYYYYYYYYLS